MAETASPTDLLDAAAAAVDVADCAQRRLVAALVALWPTAAWRAAGAATPTMWLTTCTSSSLPEARRLVRIADVAAAHPALADAIAHGSLSIGRAHVLARAVTPERRPLLTGSLPALLALGAATPDDEAFATAVRFWADRCDEHLRPRTPAPHRLHLSQRLFGGGRIEGELTGASFATVAAALDAWIQDPDPADAPHRRTLAERRADALDDLAHHALTHEAGNLDPVDDGPAVWDGDTFDGCDGRDELDEALAAGEDLDHLDALRRRLRHALARDRRRARRRVRRRSGVTTDVHVDVRTLTGRDRDDLDGIVCRTQRWRLAESAMRRLTCDSALLATLFDGPGHVLDANDAAERFSTAQRRALAARDGGCAFPTCTRPPRHCDAHHLHHRAHGGPTTVSNGALLCRFHHRLVHEAGWDLVRGEADVGWVAVGPDGRRWTARVPAGIAGSGGAGAPTSGLPPP